MDTDFDEIVQSAKGRFDNLEKIMLGGLGLKKTPVFGEYSDDWEGRSLYCASDPMLEVKATCDMFNYVREQIELNDKFDDQITYESSKYWAARALNALPAALKQCADHRLQCDIPFLGDVLAFSAGVLNGDIKPPKYKKSVKHYVLRDWLLAMTAYDVQRKYGIPLYNADGTIYTSAWKQACDGQQTAARAVAEATKVSINAMVHILKSAKHL
jgi:hypothetical protein